MQESMILSDAKFTAVTKVRAILSQNPTIQEFVGNKIFPLNAPEKIDGKKVEGDLILYRRDGLRVQDNKMGTLYRKAIFYVIAISENYNRSLSIAEAIQQSLDKDHPQYGFRIRLEDYTEEYIDKKFFQLLQFSIE